MTWNFDCSPGEASTWAQAGYYFNALMQQSTGGQVKVDVYPGEQLTNGDQVAGIQADAEIAKLFACCQIFFEYFYCIGNAAL